MRRLFPIFVLFLLLAACSTSSDDPSPGQTGPVGPAVPPRNLVASGSRDHITLSWDAASASGLTGYNVYRSADGASYSLLDTVAGTMYDDEIDSSSDYGILYSYYVKAVADEETDPTDPVIQMYGTRLPSFYDEAAELSLVAASSPYVLGGTSFIYDDLSIEEGASLYILPGSTLTMITTSTTEGEGPWLMCWGAIQSLGTAEHPVTITCTKADGSDPDGQTGFKPVFYSATPWNSSTGTGNMMRYTRMTNISSYFNLSNTTAYLENCYFSTGPEDVASFLVSGTANGTVVEHCLFTDMPLDIRGDLRGSGFSFMHNRIRCPRYGYVMFFSGIGTGQTLGVGQVSQNDMDGTRIIDIYDNKDAVAIPLGGNYWNGETPVVRQGTGVNATIDFGTPLASAPAGAGPSW